jgi:hypothetical protein
MELSSIFKWYREDFEAEDVTLQRFIQRHAGAPIDPEAQIRFLDYDWGLNGDW